MKLYRIVATMAVCLAGAFSAGAETDEVDTAPMFGLRAAFDINIPGDWHNSAGSIKMYRQGYGLTLGGVCNLYLGRGFYLEPGVSLFYDSYSYDDIEFMADSGPLRADPSLHKFGLRVPVVAGYSFDVSDKFSMSVYTGPELSWAISGRIKVKNKESIGDIPDSLFGDFHRRVDCAWKVGLGVPYNSFFIGIDAAIGMTDLLKNPNISFRENRVSVSLTYYL